MNTFWQDLRYGFRLLLKSPGFTIIAIVTMALGIGVNTALFSVVNAVVLNPLPFPAPDQLVSLYTKTSEFNEGSISYPNFLDWQRMNTTLSSVAAYRGSDYSLTGIGQPEHLKGMMISADFFPVLGVQPILGRRFTHQEDLAGAAPVVIISEGLWKRRFASSPKIIGASVVLNDVARTVVGVYPSDLPLFDPSYLPDVFVPIGQWADPFFLNRKISMGTQAIGRLKPSVSISQARSDLESVAASLASTYPDADKGSSITIVPLKEDIVGNVREILIVLLGAVGFVLLIACANVANLLLARSTGRAREFAIRVAMGAGQWRIVRQLLTESILLSLAGGILGLIIAKWGTGAVLTSLPSTLPRQDTIHLDVHVLLFMLGVSLLSGVLFGLAPALRTLRPNLSRTLQEGGRGSSGARHRTQNILVAVEMALSMILLIGAGLMIRSLAVLWHSNPGFNPSHVLAFSVSFDKDQLSTPSKARQVLRDIVAKYDSIPGVVGSSSMGGSLPMQGDSELPFWLEGQPKPSSQNAMSVALFYAIQPDYLNVMRIPLLRGRFINSSDDANAPFALVIDTEFARRYFPGQDPIGKLVNLSLIDRQAQIVGVVGHVHHWGLADKTHSNLQAEMYFSILQFPDQIFSLLSGGIRMVVRTAGPPQAFEPALRDVSEQLNPNQVVYRFQRMNEIVSNSIAMQRFSLVLFGAFAVLALVLSSVGIYGVLTYIAAQRTHEIGVRMALGAQQRDVLRMVLLQGARVTLIGVGIGLIAALGLTRLMSNIVFGVRPDDPLTFGAFALLLLLVALAACYVPAHRATRIDPLVALRYE
ncbi:MAG TPA: ABC transporter permease [Candidatus Acidoferrum sp.]|nr:ABC transporter permease [Candidatus Acidoferrum sp.]